MLVAPYSSCEQVMWHDLPRTQYNVTTVLPTVFFGLSFKVASSIQCSHSSFVALASIIAKTSYQPVYGTNVLVSVCMHHLRQSVFACVATGVVGFRV